MPTCQADWMLPIVGPPVRGGWVRTSGGRIVASGAPDSLPVDEPIVSLAGAAIMPALVNLHTHLELSWLRGRVAPAPNFIDWVTGMMREKLRAADAHDDAAHRAAMQVAVHEMRASGTGVVGDISNSLMGLDILHQSGMAGVVFHELVGFKAANPDELVVRARERAAATPPSPDWRIVLAPHAPYSVSAGLFRSIRDAVADGPTAVHVAESDDEVTFIATGEGRWRAVLQFMGAWDDTWIAPGCSPVEHLDRLGVWDNRAVAVP